MSVSLLSGISALDVAAAKCLKIPLFTEPVSAGFPSPAQDYIEQTLDLNELCIKRPNATFFVRVEGDSMIEAGIYADDILVVDRSVKAKQGDIIIAEINSELTVKELQLKPCVRLIPSALASLERAITQPSLLDNTTTGLWRKSGRNSFSQLA